MYQAAKELLQQSGYQQESYCDWKKVTPEDKNQYHFEQHMRDLLVADGSKSPKGWDMLGLGFAGVSSMAGLPGDLGWSYMNHVSLGEYERALLNGKLPTFVGFKYSEIDLKIVTLFQSIQNMRIDLGNYSALWNTDVLKEFEPQWQALLERKWIEITDKTINIVGDGGYYVPVIQGLLGVERTKQLKSFTNKVRHLPWYFHVYRAMKRAS